MYTNSELLSLYEKMVELSNRDIKFSAKVSFTILQNMRMISPIVEDIEATRANILQEYGEPVPEQPGFFKARVGEEEEMATQLTELGNMENDICFKTINLEDLQNVELSLNDMEALYPMIGGEN